VVRAKTWLVIPALGVVAAALALAARLSPETAVVVGALGAALAAAVRAFTGPSAAAAVSSGATALLGVLAVLELPGLDVFRVSLASAAGMFALAELVRPLPPDASPWPALAAALIAFVVDPAFAPLFLVAGVRYVTGPWPQPRWAIAVPTLGLLGVALAVLAALVHVAPFTDLWDVWAARGRRTGDPVASIRYLGELLGPVTAVVALAGLGACSVRGRIPAGAALGVAAGAVGIDLISGMTGAATVVAAALGAGVGIARFAAMIRWPAGQAFVGAVVGVMLVVAPVWTLADTIW
jgi:hypothetical protein